MTEAPRKIQASLLERAAQVYDFDAHLRARSGAAPARPAPILDLEFGQPPETTRVPESAPIPELAPVPKPAPQSIHPRVAAAEASVRPLRMPTGGKSIAIDRAMLSEKGLLVPGAAIGALAEEFRLVKRHLLLTAKTVKLHDGDRSRTILVCSANTGEGKTFCAVNLAISLAAERDTEVLLVDADFAKPDVMRRLGGSDGPGLLDILADPRIEAERCVVATDIPQLSLLPCGTKSNTDTELLASDRTATLIATLLAADPRRIIIFDSPPALAASPAGVLATQAGQVMLVVRADKTSEGDLRQAVALLDGCEHIQLVLNAVSFVPGGRRFGSYYGQEDAS
ncbi:AAA family ATPase [Sphingomonas alpina]|uniref:AAA family ATPase n=1 Tax=Sphingomonas alpina TaxID=653931 RepID=A0A7H0LMQ6_9SPHN|nr:AAA family ATPase [Sphingomonas alpina]QNQ10959.1 AAA family ATPase [Sphingomonas alpina]